MGRHANPDKVKAEKKIYPEPSAEAKYLGLWYVARNRESRIITKSGKCINVSIQSNGKILFAGDQITEAEVQEVCVLIQEQMPGIIKMAEQLQGAYETYRISLDDHGVQEGISDASQKIPD